jgi:hypothetical protein
MEDPSHLQSIEIQVAQFIQLQQKRDSPTPTLVGANKATILVMSQTHISAYLGLN